MYKIINILVLSLCGLIFVCEGQILQSGQCDDNIVLQANFDIDRFIGSSESSSWYEYARSDHPLGGDCSTVDFTRVGDAVTVSHSTVRENFQTDYYGTASVPAGSARMTLNMPTVSSQPINYWVWLTDYDNFALIYNCENVGTTQRRFYIWQLSRQPATLNEMMVVFMNNTMINSIGVNSNDLRVVSHSEEACFSLPIIAPGQPVILPGQCDVNIPVVQNFRAGDFLGVWHEISSYHSENALGTCGRAQYSSQDGVVVDVVNSQIINQALLTIEGYATVVSNDSSARLNVVLEILPNVTAESELLIIATDYTQWAISYTCNNLANNQKRVFSWVVSRTRTLPAAAQAQVNAVIDSILELNDAYYQPTDQSNSGCFYIPDVTESSSAVFGGQCDETISVQPNFVAANYLGLWHDIESYPTPFQFGACANAFYSLGDVGVDVYNTQVVNETLNVINGVAIPVGNEAKLVVSFPVEGTNLTTQTDYWIISTDYTSYSLVYSCRNINDYQQQIYMWKLSRTKSLTTTANTAINNALATQTVFDPRFFQSMDQSREACFYYPEPALGQPVVFPGQCEDDEVPVVPNFNLNLFYGQWFEVQAYPKEFQPGQCVEHQFSVASNTGLNLISSSVADQLLGITTSQLSLLNGTDARFSLTISNGTSPITIPYEIISTDYFNYALAYSCVNINNDFRGIYSWKLSRNRELSSSYITAINNAIASITVLAEEYFEPIDQSDSSCFYFPDLAPGEPVILPGQCEGEDVIPVVRNFDAASYLGSWRLIESYPSQFQVGACNRAQYSLNADGFVVVYNTEVINQTLSEATGLASLVLDENNQPIGKFQVTFPDALVPFELWVLDTDYNNYSLVYGCVNISNQTRQVLSWKLSRTTSLSASSIIAINAVTSNVTVLNDRYYETVDHSDAACFYYPELDGSSTIIFPGQCDESIEVVTNFDAVGYMGLWYDIERYPAPFQTGSCGNAFYTLLDGPVVDVFNTQVLNQTLDTIRGSAVLDLEDANDTSAKLLVTFPVLGFNVSTPYWVLSTDYNSYALVYSCSNIDSERRSVTSWKLSRTKALSPAAVTAINQVVNSIDVLDDRYYLTQDQTPEGCFYFPTPEPGVPVVFPGQCDDEEVSVVQNINLELFSGSWFEVQTYPKDFQPGQCVEHQFSVATSTSLNLSSSSVADQLLGITTSQLSLINGTEARFTLTISNGTGFITIPYDIVATDYSNYALAYSCVNIDANFKGIYSWKLSRNRELSSNSLTAINNAIASVTVLAEEYFEPIDQSDYSCFYFPDLAPGEPVILPGQCEGEDVIPVVRNFDAASYLGSWRLIESYPSQFQVGNCNRAQYSLNADGLVVVYNTEVVNQTLSEDTGLATLVLDENNIPIGKFLVTFPDAPVPFELWVLDTDYNNYSLVYGCVNIGNQTRQVQSWKMSRTTSLSPSSTAAINAVMNNVTVLNNRYYETVDHSDAACFYYPELDGSSTVVFPGQCDESIEVVTNFDAVAYMGLWHDIERYPAPFQPGTCGNAFYTLLDGPVVDVFNTQVINQTLDTIRGSAVLDLVDANDTSAKLLVTFPTTGSNMSTPYWVLSTDYISYALVYSCTNIDAERRSVTSWKLSRTKTLQPTAVAAINQVVNSIDVLDDRYFLPQDQSPEGCFYFPEPEPGVPVVFPGQCDADVTVVQNFNLTAFQGTWHEIETYPKIEQDGQCISHEFTVSDENSMTFASSNVIAQSLGVTTGAVRFAFNDNTGRLLLTFFSNNTIISIPYWIVDTDYENYALVYSCVAINSDFRGVWSWKLSRTKTIASTSASAINQAIAGNVVLDDVYYEPISQTDESCFYYPETGPGESVVFPGQCDPNISVVQNFDAARYLGVWRTIETYASEFQLGDCGNANYSLNANGTVDVFNTEVINQTLSTINGLAVVASDDGSGKLLVTFPDAPFPSEYWILATDYDSYALVYSCFNINSDQRRVYSWKLSRSRYLSQQAQTAINAAISQVDVLDSRYYGIVNQTDESCFYFPEADGSPVVFPGQCDESIDVVMNFDATRYTGVWYDIQSYPAPFQGGTCGTANYDLDLSTLVVSVENTQVVNPDGFGPVLDVQLGTAVVASNDTSAKLLVNFIVNGVNVTSNYWVLSTDYDNYAFVYSCQNLNDEYRQVNSWKLSRTRNLTSAANAEIALAINRVQVLEERYFIDGGQSEEECFFYPENNGGDVILEGQCVPDGLVDAVPAFNANSFAGTWYEAARFPSGFQEGECTDAEFSVGAANSIIFTQTEVDNQLLSINIVNGTLSTDGRGIIYTEINGSPLNFYILGVNYNEWALLYGCRNLVNNTKQVYSWKLSRSRLGIFGPANNLIDNIVRENEDLFENYYYYTNQTDDSCFYVPEVNVNEAPLFRGQCDENVAGVTNFNATMYAGWWHEIERYPVDNNLGECISSQYQASGSTYLVTDTVVANGSATVSSGTVQVTADGRLRRTINGQVQDIWVLATDYETYSLLYSCDNADDNEGYRRVWSAKHSKARQLTAAAQSAMAPVIEANQLLYPQFYQPVDQSDEACFHYPDLNGGRVILPGQCDDNIPVVQNFDVEAYAGTWYQIEKYPSNYENPSSTCIGARYTLDASGTISVLNWEVIDGELMTIEGNATVTSTDGSARLTVTLPVRGSPTNEVVSRLLFVLNTDYENFALAYTCSNVNAFQRSIGSWKLSRQRTLDPEYYAVINNYMSSRDELHQPYFTSVQQDEDCEEPSSGALLRSSIIVMVICALWQILS